MGGNGGGVASGGSKGRGDGNDKGGDSEGCESAAARAEEALCKAYEMIVSVAVVLQAKAMVWMLRSGGGSYG